MNLSEQERMHVNHLDNSLVHAETIEGFKSALRKCYCHTDSTSWSLSRCVDAEQALHHKETETERCNLYRKK